ncbi:condensin subunit ScpB [Dethiosulfatibacter aminovorans DSM 17477]|uniref:Segregation and condensation protein B n=1 Tax=Dethiosulfatibacter aminovorans DSM 17477 TaxID=1121476 RepID=A0A1M6DA04_9FIRM|nr:SMC-Scp complex subunit ScpB [Dethiosulfatibacter aminovorans]SHI70097.1 condensin subunit ScpB [Dethiosulfatibacter aminovorans DSM 17477]
MNKNRMKSIIESILFAWGEPIRISEISKILNIKPSTAKSVLVEMAEEYEAENRGIVLKKANEMYQLKTKNENFPFINQLFKPNTRNSLSHSALEALSIIAYKQPVTKIEIDQIRGVKSDYILKSLVDKKLIAIKGKLDKPGKPSLYGTTDHFLAHFGLESIDNLPALSFEENMDNMEKIINESE